MKIRMYQRQPIARSAFPIACGIISHSAADTCIPCVSSPSHCYEIKEEANPSIFFSPTVPKMNMPISPHSLKISRSFFRYYSPSRFFFHPNPNPNSSLACRLNTRAVIRFRGPDTARFLQGLLTNDVRKLTGGDGTPSSTSYLSTPNVPFRTPPPIYSALLTPQGRFLYDLFLYRAPSGETKLDRTGSGPGSGKEEELTVLADVDAVEVEEILGCFKK